MKPVLLDTSFIVALLHRRAERHEECAAAVSDLNRPFVTCDAVITESCYLLQRAPQAVDAVLANVESGLFQVSLRLAEAASAIREIMLKYRDLPASFADACLIHLADECSTGDILTLDSDFLTYRWRKTRVFQPLVPL